MGRLPCTPCALCPAVPTAPSAFEHAAHYTLLEVGRQGGKQVIIDCGAAELVVVRCHKPLSFVVHEDLAGIGGR
jgi:hypothetical protein